MIDFKRKERRVPALNTASLPDLIFSVLFFFIIVTHMRQDEVKVRYRVPEGTELSKLARRSSVVHIYIGKQSGSGRYSIQLENRCVGIDELVDRLSQIKSSMQPDDARQLTVAISADKDADMQTVMDVKQALRRANALRITFIGTEKASRSAKATK